MRTESRKSRWGYLLLSILLHLFLWKFPTLLPPPGSSQRETIEMNIVETPPPQPEKKVKIEEKLKIVDQDEKPLNDEIDDKAKFLSAHNQKVVKETLAQQRGEFQNKKIAAKLGDGTPKQQNSMEAFLPKIDVAKAVKEREEMEQKFDEDAEFREKKKAERKEKKPVAQKDAGTTPGADASKTLDYIKELDPGLETLLSTKEFKYYTYFARIRQQLNQHWTPRVRVKVQEIYKQGRSIASSDDMVTRCLVTLDKNGRLLRIQIIGDSGIHELDEAAVEAFRAAAPFPHPPKGMIDPDGTIKIRWDFILEA